MFGKHVLRDFSCSFSIESVMVHKVILALPCSVWVHGDIVRDIVPLVIPY